MIIFYLITKKEHWQILAKGKWRKFANGIKYLDKHLNNNCHRIENNCLDKFKDIVKQYNINSGYYYDFYSKALELKTDDFKDICNDSFLVCLEQRIAFFFHHDGWL